MASQVESIKWVPGTTFLVDGFRYINPKCTAYFLTHFHSDHTVGLRKSFDAGPIYCSPITAALAIHDLGVSPKQVFALPLHHPTVIQGVTVTLLDANHCPGSAMVLFQVPQKDGSLQTILHTGDCRWQPWMREQPVLRDVQVDLLFLDTTYALPRHNFPPQKTAIELMVRAMQEARRAEPATLFVMSTYHIGKERAFLGAAKALDCKVWCSASKHKVLRLLDLPPDHMAMLTDDEDVAGIRVVNWGLKPDSLQPLLQERDGRWKQVVGIRPTGWTFRKNGLQVWRQGAVVMYGVPYSEHSSWGDLCDCVRGLKPRKIIPTVNANNPEQARTIVDRFASLMDLSHDRSRLDMYFPRLLRQFCSQGGVQADVAGAARAVLTTAGRALGLAGAVVKLEEGAATRTDLGIEDEEETGVKPDPDGIDWQVDARFACCTSSACVSESGVVTDVHWSADIASRSSSATCTVAFHVNAVETIDSCGAAGPPPLASSSTPAGVEQPPDLDAVDVDEQLQIWEGIQRENERLRRLQQSLAAAAAAKNGRKRGRRDTGNADKVTEGAPGDTPGSQAPDTARHSAEQNGRETPSRGNAKKTRRPSTSRRRASQDSAAPCSTPTQPCAVTSSPGVAVLAGCQHTQHSMAPGASAPVPSQQPSATAKPSLFVSAPLAALAADAELPLTLPNMGAAGQQTITAMFARLTGRR